jgi:hypothetical protein
MGLALEKIVILTKALLGAPSQFLPAIVPGVRERTANTLILRIGKFNCSTFRGVSKMKIANSDPDPKLPEPDPDPAEPQYPPAEPPAPGPDVIELVDPGRLPAYRATA